MASGGGELGRGGMTTKVRAADLAARSGTDTIIVGGRIDNVITRLMQGEELGTLLFSDQEPLEARKLWLAGLMKSKGALVLDDGAVIALKKGGVSLLPIGVCEVNGTFAEGDMVTCVDKSGHEVAKGLINYASSEASRLKGMGSNKLMDVLGYQGDPELIHCDNLVVL
jgi:glutamate 5-kinase